ncbi:hypothetical protein LRB11_15955 [Ectothiorhodospira haloalkaliphila]|uniref:hypothetical protein n=1 Tax=Ectothiorhodospira haloalkaliphila TaxID=421628 RepID=UPI001EE8B93E|nr:hypothetical protein [Ectothiorhodospira haloalkaliphila]MCG5526406.1 hypothetical protein [Ectothiorhodospira haloalkaliphila]
MRVEIWGSQVHVVDLVSGSLLLIAAGFLLWSVWAIRCKGFRRYWGGVSKVSAASMAGLIAVIGAVLHMLGAVVARTARSDDSDDNPCYYGGPELKKVGQIDGVVVKGDDDDRIL